MNSQHSVVGWWAGGVVLIGRSCARPAWVLSAHESPCEGRSVGSAGHRPVPHRCAAFVIDSANQVRHQR